MEAERKTGKVLYSGARFRVERVLEEIAGETRERDVVRHPGATVVLPVLDDGRVVLVEQHRTAVGHSLLELPAGTLESGEDPEAAARRELQEETGYVAGNLIPMVNIFPAPGLTDERMHIYLATELTPGEPDPDPGEHIDVKTLTVEDVRQRILRREIIDGKTLCGLLFVMFVGMEAESSEADANGSAGTSAPS